MTRATMALGRAGWLGRPGSQDVKLSNLENFALRQRLNLALSFLQEVEQTLLRSRTSGRRGTPPGTWG